ncbi:MAG: HD domain-containing protein [Gammaproteobacteria bacterium]|nr:HD domain-containing protein [Gammaproteobacteria bacterium]MBU1625698.1 HD domain-containing protein [Gammaproteobacteria bacterium]MBU1980958.1 HD domain-containing protein [Gammaproteobacteria bacterium]
MASYNVNLHEVVYSLSNALDLVGVSHIHHGKRVAYMATEVGKQLGWNGPMMDDLFQSAILHDIGVSKTQVHKHLAELEWELEKDHCIVGHDLLQGCSLLSHLSGNILYHHSHWEVLERLELDDSTKLIANCIYLVDRVDVQTLREMAGGQDILLGKDRIWEMVRKNSGDWFYPGLVEAFMEVSKSDAFWFRLEREHVNGYLSTWLSHSGEKAVSFTELKKVVEIFSYVVDAKSSFTKEHSEGVAMLAHHLGREFALSEESCELLELAGLLHDIGKLRVPDELLEKTGSLSETEYCVMHRHSFDTYDILKNIRGMEQVATWAAQHHERVDGSGYPYMSGEHEISIEARILAVADVFQALAQRRPYREALPPEKILKILQLEADSGKLDRVVVAKVEKNLQHCWETSLLMK